MDDLPVVDMLHSEANLREPVQDLDFGEGAPTLVLDPLLQITT